MIYSQYSDTVIINYLNIVLDEKSPKITRFFWQNIRVFEKKEKFCVCFLLIEREVALKRNVYLLLRADSRVIRSVCDLSVDA